MQVVGLSHLRLRPYQRTVLMSRRRPWAVHPILLRQSLKDNWFGLDAGVFAGCRTAHPSGTAAILLPAFAAPYVTVPALSNSSGVSTLTGSLRPGTCSLREMATLFLLRFSAPSAALNEGGQMAWTQGTSCANPVLVAATREPTRRCSAVYTYTTTPNCTGTLMAQLAGHGMHCIPVVRNKQALLVRHP